MPETSIIGSHRLPILTLVPARMAAKRYEIRESVASDVYILAANLRDGDRLEVASFGKEPRSALRLSFRHAILRRTAIVDGEIAAMWGLGGSMLDDTGYPWLLTSPAVERVPVSFLREGRREVARMLRLRRVLVGYVAASYHQACDFLERLGFTLGPVVRLPPLNNAFREFRIERDIEVL
jgi:hypothetical protein